MSRKMIFVACLAIFGLSACTSSSNNNKSEVDTSEGAVSQEAQATPERARDSAGARTAVAALESRSESSVTGTVTFTQDEGDEAKVTVSYEIHGLTPGETRGFHVHETGDCSAPDATSAGGHFNPYSHDHGAMDAEESHVGDLGNITADAEGNAVGVIEDVTKFSLTDGELNNVVGRAVIVHAKADDLVSQPTGDAGGRVACGVIALK